MGYQTGRLKETYIQSQTQYGRNRYKSTHTAQGKQRNPGNCRESPGGKPAEASLH